MKGQQLFCIFMTFLWFTQGSLVKGVIPFTSMLLLLEPKLIIHLKCLEWFQVPQPHGTWTCKLIIFSVWCLIFCIMALLITQHVNIDQRYYQNCKISCLAVDSWKWELCRIIENVPNRKFKTDLWSQWTKCKLHYYIKHHWLNVH